MKIGLRAHDFGRNEPELLAAKIAEAGFETAQLALTKAITGINSFGDIKLSVLERVRRAFEDKGVEIGVLGCYVEIGDTDRDKRLNEVEKFRQGLEHAKELGVKLVGTETTRFAPSAPDSLREAAYRGLKDSVSRMAEKAEETGILIGMETVADHTLNNAAMTRRLLDEVGSAKLRVILDPVNLILSQQDIQNQEKIYEEFFEAVGPAVAALHMKDIVLEGGEKIWRNIGQGEIRYETIFGRLRSHAHDIPVLREELRPESCQMDILAMKSCMQKGC